MKVSYLYFFAVFLCILCLAHNVVFSKKHQSSQRDTLSVSKPHEDSQVASSHPPKVSKPRAKEAPSSKIPALRKQERKKFLKIQRIVFFSLMILFGVGFSLAYFTPLLISSPDIPVPPPADIFSKWASEIEDKRKRSIVFRETLTTCSKGFYSVNGNTIHIQTKFPPVTKHAGYIYHYPVTPQVGWKNFGSTRVFSVVADSFETSRFFLENGKKVAVLNFADAYKPGGEVMHGYPTQEEALCRVSNLFASIRYAKESVPNTYPIQMDKNFAALYSEGVTVFRNIDYSFLETPFVVDVLSIAFLYLWNNRTEVRENNPVKQRFYPITPEEIEEMTLQRIRTIFQVAAEKRVDTLILGAIGCGDFHNDPYLNSRLFMQVLKNEFYGVFENVVFPDYSISKNFVAFSAQLRLAHFPAFPRFPSNSLFAKKLATHIRKCTTNQFINNLKQFELRKPDDNLSLYYCHTFSALVADAVYDSAFTTNDYNSCYNRILQIASAD